MLEVIDVKQTTPMVKILTHLESTSKKEKVGVRVFCILPTTANFVSPMFSLTKHSGLEVNPLFYFTGL